MTARAGLRDHLQLILIEGIPGSGKSTAAARLHRTLRAMGIEHHWWYEGEKGHPLYTFDDQASLDSSLKDLFSGDDARRQRVVDETLQRWGALADDLAKGEDVAIFDGMLFGHLTWTLFPAGAPNEVTMAYVAGAERRAAAARPCLIYLRQDDVRAALERIAQRRGDRWTESFVKRHENFPYSRQRGLSGFDGLVAFWEDYQQLADDLFDRSVLPKCRIRVDPNEWDAVWSGIGAFLGLEQEEDGDREVSAELPAGGASLGRYVGTYSYERGGQEVHCRVNVEDGRLIIDSWADVWRRTPLVPVGDADEGRFATESFPYDVTFVTGEDGSVQEMRVEGPDSVWGSVPRRLRREPTASP